MSPSVRPPISHFCGKFLCSDHRVRIRTNYEIYWDQAYFVLGAQTKPCRVSQEVPCRADLEYHGFSRMIRASTDAPELPDYTQLLSYRAYPPLAGYCTAYGDVTGLVRRSDDQWVTINSGDQCTVRFPVPPPPPRGWVRDFLIRLDGCDKDKQYDTACSATVQPYPFHAMNSYPYGMGQHYPEDAAHQTFLRRTLTRWAGRGTGVNGVGLSAR